MFEPNINTVFIASIKGIGFINLPLFTAQTNGRNGKFPNQTLYTAKDKRVNIAAFKIHPDLHKTAPLFI
jgi:hypothetical protein